MTKGWNFPFFIARRLQHQQTDGKKTARPITRIAILSIALAMIVNLVTIAVVRGFQQEVSEKVTGFGSHLSVLRLGEPSIMESSGAPLRRNKDIEAALKSVKGISSVMPVACKPALLQSVSRDEQREILGVVLKGVDNDYNWTFLQKHLVQGRLPKFGTKTSNEILISRQVCKDLHYKLGDTANAFFVKQQPLLRQFVIAGIYETGLEDFDRQMVFCHLPQVQALNDWGIQASIAVDDTLENGELIIRAEVTGGNGHFRYDWGKGFEAYQGFTICPTADTTIRLIAADYWRDIRTPAGLTEDGEGETALADTAYLDIKVSGDRYTYCTFRLNSDNELLREYTDDLGYSYDLSAGEKTVHITSRPGKGSFSTYVGGYELLVDDWDQLPAIHRKVEKTISFRPEWPQQAQVRSIQETQSELFVWLGFLDLNMAIVLTLMLIIGMINICSALLVMILVRTNFIGIMKAMGATNWEIRKLFILLAGKLILRGVIWGNTIGIGFCLLQHYFGIMPLDPKVYYLSKVPISIDLMTIIYLNLFTMAICTLALLLPSIVITRVSPAKSIRFR